MSAAAVTGRGWIGELRALGVPAVARALGLAVEKGHSSDAFPCPECGHAKRHASRHDRRGACGTTPDRMGWACHDCHATGDAVSLAAAIVTGKAEHAAGAPAWREVREAVERAGLVLPSEDADRPASRTAPPRPLREPVAAPEPPPQERPPRDEVAALWASCGPVTADAEVAAWHAGAHGMKARPGIRLDRVAGYDLARVLPEAAELPAWCATWGRNGFRLVVPAYDLRGELVSLRARRLRPAEDGPKELAPRGFAAAGLTMADPLALGWLRGHAEASGIVARNGLMVAEGAPAFLTWATHWGDEDTARGVLGIFSGSWTQEMADRVPDGATVRLAVDNDGAGDKYAGEVERTLRARITAGSVVLMDRFGQERAERRASTARG